MPLSNVRFCCTAPNGSGRATRSSSAGRHGFDAVLVEHEAVEEAFRAGLARRVHVAAVRLDDGGRMRAQRRRHGGQRAVALVCARLRERPARRARLPGDAPHLVLHRFPFHGLLFEDDQLVAMDERLVGQACQQAVRLQSARVRPMANAARR